MIGFRVQGLGFRVSGWCRSKSSRLHGMGASRRRRFNECPCDSGTLSKASHPPRTPLQLEVSMSAEIKANMCRHSSLYFTFAPIDLGHQI